ncbi:hypothetical protein HPP92_010520 [Vanilla planifolia]|uniref:Uncharacterized protein n=1 Tax=Vanilla planifolia TaxID=51239 RepID=A0A835UZD2_VANPL|nr:hypothetical protein HPP92_010520 [Vanilla planifolia]
MYPKALQDVWSYFSSNSGLEKKNRKISSVPQGGQKLQYIRYAMHRLFATALRIQQLLTR